MLPEDHWRLRSLKGKSCNARARLLLMHFAYGDAITLQLTLPITCHKDSKATKAVVDSLLVYGAHHINHKEVRIGKQTL